MLELYQWQIDACIAVQKDDQIFAVLLSIDLEHLKKEQTSF